MAKRTLFFVPYAGWTLHFETDLELIRLAREAGEEVTVVYCDGELDRCEPDPRNRFVDCHQCRMRRKAGFAWLNDPDVRYLSLKDLGPFERDYPVPEDLQAFKSFTLQGSDLGMAALSSSVSFLREPKPEWERHGPILLGFLRSAIRVHEAFRRLFEKERFDRVVLFNGRFAPLRPLLRHAQRLGITVQTHERGLQEGYYRLIEGSYPHDPVQFRRTLQKTVEGSLLSLEEKKAIARRWFEARRRGDGGNWKSFTRLQRRDDLPREWKEEPFKIVVFISSEDEFVAIKELQEGLYEDQNAGIDALATALAPHKEIRLFVREHPNLAGIDNSQTRSLRELARKHGNLTLIEATDSVDSYALIKYGDVTVSFGSTVGVEAAFWGRPSMLLGKAFYDFLGCCVIPKSHEDAVEILLEFKRTKRWPETADTAWQYGFFMHEARGVPFRYVKQIGLNGAKLVASDGTPVDLNRSWGVRLNRLLRPFAKAWRLLKGER